MGEYKTSSGFIERVKALFGSRLRKNENSRSLEMMDPLFLMDAARAENVFNLARNGNYSQIQFIYNEIERTDPTLLVCVTRRSAALAELGWKVVQSDQRLFRKADAALVTEQIEAVETAVARIENFPDAVEHLALAAFRGFSHVSPVHTIDGMVKRFDLLDNWNFCYDRKERCWLWNPSASGYVKPRKDSDGLKAIPPKELVSVVEKRAIDWPALKIFLRSAIGERDWGRFLETYGLPPVIITMPEFTSKDQEDDFVRAAESVFEGRNGVVPYGSQISWAAESRGVNPFSEFLEHQQKLIVLMATGGILTSLAESGSGTLGGGAHEDTWRQIVRRDVRVLSNVINKQMCEDVVRREFPGKPILARFEFDTEPPPSAKDVLELAGLANAAGMRMDPKEVSEATGYTITIREDAVGAGDGVSALDNGTQVNEQQTAQDESEDDLTGKETSVPYNSQEAANLETVVNARSATVPVALNADAGDKARGSTPEQRLAWSLQIDFKDVADRLNAIINLPEEEKADAARKLMGELDTLVPNDPAMAAVIAEQMADAFAGVANKGDADAGAENAKVSGEKLVKDAEG